MTRARARDAQVLREPAISITIGAANAAAETIEQRLTFVGREEGKLVAMRQLIQQGLRPPVLIFLQVPRAPARRRPRERDPAAGA